ncbi:MAG: ribonuclease Z [Bacteroidales bacterium]|nr:ribonuclease Z [Bacteroidales bacterium]
MSFILTVLGSSSALPTATRFPTAQVLNVHERFFLIDCGEGTQIQLRRFSLNMSRIRHVFISHLHGDHVFGLFGLFSSYNLMGRKTDLHVFAHRDFEPTLAHYLEYFGKDLTYRIIFHPFTAKRPDIIHTDKHVSVQTIPLRHSVPVVGFIFREQEKLLNVNKEAIQKYGLTIQDIRKIKEGKDFETESGKVIRNSELTLLPYRPRSYAFCTDTLYFRKLVNYLKDVDLLYFEATFSNKDRKLARMTGHSTSVQAAELARDANAGRLIMGHFSTRYKNTEKLLKEACAVFPDSHVVEDGDRYEVALTRIASS